MPFVEADHPQYALLRIPNSYELAVLMDQVLGPWSLITTVASGKPIPGPAPLSLEYSVLLRGPFRSRLVLRAQHALGALLAANASPEKSEEAFKELCHRVVEALLERHFGGGHATFEPYQAQSSAPEQWPSRMPDAESVMAVEGHLLEARLWVEPTKMTYVAEEKYQVLRIAR
jgi:hypothetical protein